MHAISSFGAKKKKNMKKKSGKLHVPILCKLRGLFLSNLVCKVVYMGGIKYVSLIEIGIIVFKLQYAEIG